MREFWVSSGHHLTRLTPAGELGVTDELLLAWLARPEIVPPDDACDAERGLHDRMRRAPRAPVGPEAVAAMADPDARENWAFFLGFRLLAAGSIEAAYLGIVRERVPLPHIFLEQLVHLVMRNALDGCGDPWTLRAAELFWRVQRGSVRDGGLVLADAERVEALEAETQADPLLAMFSEGVDDALEVMTEENAWTYWSRSDAHSMALPFGSQARARAGLAGAIAAYVRHLLGVEVLVEPLAAVEEPDLRWYVGLDAVGSAIGDALWSGGAAAQDGLVGLFRLSAVEEGSFEPRMEGHPVYLLMGMAEDRTVRLKPQNLVMGLPLRVRRKGARWRASI
jgi:hypothetical protein